MRAHRPSTAAVSVLSLAVFAAPAIFVFSGACSKDKPAPDPSAAPPPPPPIEVTKAGACASGGGQVADPVSAGYFPRALKVGGTSGADWCVDPQGETRTYGDKGKLTMDEVCTTAVDGECEVYKRYGLKRFVSLRYVDGGGNGGSVEIYLSQYADAAGAYAMYTKRVVADGDPADPSAPRPLDAGGAGAMGTGRAYVWRGDEVAELQYINENESPEQLAKSSDAVLAPLAKQIGAKLPGALEKPQSAAALPAAGLVSTNAVTYFPKDALGFANVGAGAMGFYKDGERRYRLAAVQKADADQAKDVMKTIRSRPGALPVASGPGEESVHVVLQASPESAKVEWLFTRKGALVAGAGDEELSLRPGDAPDKQAAARLTKDEAVAKLKAWLAAPGPGPAAPTPGSTPAPAAPKKN